MVKTSGKPDCWTFAGLSAANEVFQRKWRLANANKTHENR